jgi:small subunit ribosomal protein S11
MTPSNIKTTKAIHSKPHLHYWDKPYSEVSEIGDAYTAYVCSDEVDLCATDAAEFHLTATDNNCHVHVWWRSSEGKHRSVSLSTGRVGYKGAKRGTAEAAQTLLRTVCARILGEGIKSVHVFLNGMGPGRGVTHSVLEREGLDIVSISDTTPTPHGGCRGKKMRRV